MKKNVIIVCLVGLLIALGVVGFQSRHSDHERINELEAQAAMDGKVYAISKTGHLVIADGQQARVVSVEVVNKPFSLEELNGGKSLMIVGENSVGTRYYRSGMNTNLLPQQGRWFLVSLGFRI